MMGCLALKHPASHCQLAGCISAPVEIGFCRAKAIGADAKIACEILESHTKRLHTLENVSEYIMSHEMLSKYIAMVAEDRKIHKVLCELFSSKGNEIYLRQPELYTHPEESMSFWGLTVRARARREVLMGYWEAGHKVSIRALYTIY